MSATFPVGRPEAPAAPPPMIPATVGRATRLGIVLGLNLVLLAGLAVVGLSAHSIGVLAAAVDDLADAAAIGVAVVALCLSRRPTTGGHPARPRGSAIAALVNAGWLIVLCALVVAGSAHRLSAGVPSVDGLPVVVVSGVAALVMVAGAVVLGGDVDNGDDSDADLSLRAVLLDTLADAASAGGVAAAGGVILATGGLDWLDPAVALVIAVVVGFQALRLLRQVVANLS